MVRISSVAGGEWFGYLASLVVNGSDTLHRWLMFDMSYIAVGSLHIPCTAGRLHACPVTLFNAYARQCGHTKSEEAFRNWQ